MRQQPAIKSYLLHIFALNGFAIAQPVMNLLGDNPDFFVARGSQYLDVVVLTLILVLGLGTILAFTYTLLSRVSPRLLQWVHLSTVAVLVTLVFLPALKKLNIDDGLILPAAASIGALFSVLYYKLQGLRLFVSALSPMSLVFAGFFLFGSAAMELRQPVVEKQPAEVGATSNNTPVIFVIFDEFALTSLMDRDRNVDKTLFPNFHELTQAGSWYRNTTTVASSTMLSVPAMLTGNFPRAFVSQSHQNYPDTLFTLLAGSHRMNVFESTTSMCAPTLCSSSLKLKRSAPLRSKLLLADVSAIYLHIIADQALAARLPVINMTWENYWQLEDTDTWERHNYGGRMEQLEFFVESISADGLPGLNLIHTNFPHIPYQYLPSGKRYQGEWEIPGLDYSINQWGDNAWLVTQAYQRFLLQVASADLLIGKLLGHLRSIGIYDESLIIVTADHGVSFYPDSHRRGVPPMANLERDILPVPLFIKYPFQEEGQISDENVETIDILPTITDVLDTRTDLEMDGRSLIGPEAPREQKLAYYGYKDFLQYTSSANNEYKYATLDWKVDTFRTLTGPAGVFRIGAHAGLVGSGVDDFDIDRSRDLEITLDTPGLYTAVNLDSGFVPSQVSGFIDSTLPDLGLDLVVSVNGSIQAVTEMYATDENSYRFSAMVPEWSFRDGQNDVAVFQLATGPDKQTRLVTGTEGPVKGSRATGADTWRLSGDRVLGNGLVLPSGTAKLKGELEYAASGGGAIEFFGWALDIDSKETVDKILVFENGEFVYAGVTQMPRGEGPLHGADQAILTGFQFVLPDSLFEHTSRSSIRLFAVSRHGYATELGYFEDYQFNAQ